MKGNGLQKYLNNDINMAVNPSETYCTGVGGMFHKDIQNENDYLINNQTNIQ